MRLTPSNGFLSDKIVYTLLVFCPVANTITAWVNIKEYSVRIYATLLIKYVKWKYKIK